MGKLKFIEEQKDIMQEPVRATANTQTGKLSFIDEPTPTKKKSGGVESSQSLVEDNADLSFTKTMDFINAPTVNVGAAKVTIDKTPIPFAENPKQYSKGLQQRINTKTFNNDDVNVVASSMKVSPLAANAFMKGDNDEGVLIAFEDFKKDKEVKLKNDLNNINTQLGTTYSPTNFNSIESVKDFLTDVENRFSEKNKQEREVNIKETIDEGGFPQYIGQKVAFESENALAESDASLKNIRAALYPVLSNIVNNDTNLTYDQKVNTLARNMNEKEYKNINDAKVDRVVRGASTNPFTQFGNIVDYVTNAPEKQDEILNSNKAVAELQLNKSINDDIVEKTALVNSLVKQANKKSADGTLTEQEAKDLDTQVKDIQADLAIKKGQYQSYDTLLKKYPSLFKKKLVDDINEFNAIRSGNVKGSEDGGYEDTNIIEHLKSKGYDINDQKVLDVIKSGDFKDYDFFGSPLKSIVDVFGSTAKSIGDITGVRGEADIVAEKKNAELFPTQVSDNDEYQLTGKAKIGQNIGNVSGQVIGQALLQYGTAGLGRLAGLSRLAASNAAFWSSGALTSYDDALKDSKDFIDNKAGQVAYAGLISLANAATEKIFPDIKLAEIPAVKNTLSELAQKIGTKGFTDGMAKDLLGKAKNEFLDYAKKYATNVGKETVEEVATSLFESGARFVFGDPNISVGEAVKRAKETAIQTATGMAAIGAVGAYKDKQRDNNYSNKSMLYNAALYHDEGIDAINKGYMEGLYGENEKNEKIQTLNTARTAIDVTNQAEKINDVKLSRPQKEVYVANLTAESLLKKEKEKSDDEVLGKKIDGKINELQQQRTEILDGTIDIDEEGNITTKIPTEKINELQQDADVIKQIKAEDAATKDENIIPTFEKIKETVSDVDFNNAENVIQRVNNAEEINENELNSASDVLYEAWDKAPDARHLIEPLIQKLQDYELATKTETGTVTEKEPIEGTTGNKSKREIKPALEQSEGSEASITDKEGNITNGILKIKDGNYQLEVEGKEPIVIGETQITNRDLKLPGAERVPEPIQFDENSNVRSVTFETKDGNLISINNPEKALDLAIQLQADAIGEIPDAAFEKAYTEFEKEVTKEVPKYEEKTEAEKPVSETNAGDTAGNESVQPTEGSQSKEIVGETAQPHQKVTKDSGDIAAAEKTTTDEKDNSKSKGGQKANGKETNGESDQKNNGKEGVLEETGAEPPKKESAPLTEKEDGSVGITHAATEKIREQYDVDFYEKGEPQTIAGWDKEATERIEKEGISPLLKKLRDGGYISSPVEQRMMLQYIGQLDTKVSKNPTSENLGKLKEALYLSDKIGGTDAARTLVSRKGSRRATDSLASFLVDEMDDSQTNTLTDKQIEIVKTEHDLIKSKEDALQNKLKELEAKVSEKLAKEELVKIKKTSPKTNIDHKAKRDELKTRLKKEFEEYKAQFGKVGFTPESAGYERFKLSIKMAKTISEIVKDYASEGVEKLDDIVSMVFNDVKDDITGIEESDIRDVIAGKYVEPKGTRKDLAIKLQNLKIEQKLIDELSDLIDGKEPTIENKKIKRNKRIAELQKKIKGHDLTKLAETKKRLRKQIDDVNDKIQKGEYEKVKIEKPIVTLDTEALKLKDELIKVKNERELRRLRSIYKNQNGREKALAVASEILNLPRAIMATLDFSAPLRQGVIPTISHPSMVFNIRKDENGKYKIGGAGTEMFKGAFSEKNYNRWFYDLENSPRYDEMVDSGLAITDMNNPKLQAHEEQFMSNLAHKIPILKFPIKGSERAYSMFLNKMRVDLYNRFANAMEERGLTIKNSPKEYEQMAHYVNNSTGRGDLGETLNKIAPLLNGLFFSPRLIASRLNMLTYLMQKRFYTTVPKEVRAAYFKDMGKFIAIGATVLALFKYGYGGDDEDKDKITVETDPRSPDFGKIKQGNTRWDMWGGFQQYARVIAQIASGATKSPSGVVKELGGDSPFSKTRTGIALNTIRGKLSPTASMAVDIFSGEDIIGNKIVLSDWGSNAKGNKVGAGEYIANHFLPLNAVGLYEGVKEQGVKAFLTVGVPSTFGIGVQTYETPVSTKKNFTIYQESGNKKREATDEEVIKVKAIGTDKAVVRIEKIQKTGVGLNKYGEITIDEDKIVKKQKYNDLSDDEKKKLEKRIISNEIEKEKNKLKY